MVPLEHFLFISAALFCIGLAIVITKKNAIVILMGIELILNAANINLVAFSQYDQVSLKGNMFALFIIVIAAAEAAVALAIVLKVYHYFKTANIDEINELKG
jgi:NADH:ubiquinone oxidoreductase subunit K